MADQMKLTVIIPVYNEKHTILEVIRRVKDVQINKEIIVVDDGSTDGTREMIKNYKKFDGIKFVFHEKNCGKGSAIKTGLKFATGDVTIIQDADLEQEPSNYTEMLDCIIHDSCDAVFGSRLLSWGFDFNIRYLANLCLALTTSILYRCNLSDVMTGYKMIKTSILRELDLKSNGFNIETEIAAKLLKKKIRMKEIPITYRPRSYTEGKKIRFRDSFGIIWALVKNRLTSS